MLAAFAEMIQQEDFWLASPRYAGAISLFIALLCFVCAPVAAVKAQTPAQRVFSAFVIFVEGVDRATVGFLRLQDEDGQAILANIEITNVTKTLLALGLVGLGIALARGRPETAGTLAQAEETLEDTHQKVTEIHDKVIPDEPVEKKN